MNDDDDLLDDIDLHAWRVPPPAAIDRPLLVMRALSPAAAAAKRPRLGWLLAGIVLVNAAIVALLVILLARPTATTTRIIERPAGGAVDAKVHDVLARLEQEQRRLEGKLSEIQELRDLVLELSERVRKCEQRDAKREPKVPRQRIDNDATCDEVSCVLQNYNASCCAKYRRDAPPVASPSLPESLDWNRGSIMNGIASVKAKVMSCGVSSSVHGTVKVRVVVRPDGLVRDVTVEATPDPALGKCVEAAVVRAVFPQTQLGGSFTYPVVF